MLSRLPGVLLGNMLWLVLSRYILFVVDVIAVAEKVLSGDY